MFILEGVELYRFVGGDWSFRIGFSCLIQWLFFQRLSGLDFEFFKLLAVYLCLRGPQIAGRVRIHDWATGHCLQSVHWGFAPPVSILGDFLLSSLLFISQILFELLVNVSLAIPGSGLSWMLAFGLLNLGCILFFSVERLSGDFPQSHWDGVLLIKAAEDWAASFFRESADALIEDRRILLQIGKLL